MLRMIVRDLLVPGSITFLLLAMTIGVAALYFGQRTRNWARIWLVSLLSCYWLMGTDVGAGWLEDWTDGGYRALVDAEASTDIEAIVVLSGGGNTYRNSTHEINTPGPHTAFRTLEAIRLHNILPEALLIVSGGIGDPQGLSQPESKIMREELVRAGIPKTLMVLETNSRNTHEQAINVTAMLRERDIEGFVLVTSAAHMHRALGTFKAQGLEPVPSVASTQSTEMPAPRWPWLPSVGALSSSRASMREILAIYYYQQQGWVQLKP